LAALSFSIMGDPESDSRAIKHLEFSAPLLAVEQVGIQKGEDGHTLHATKTIDANDPYLSGHFPNFTLFPGVFIIESLRQAVALAMGESEGRLPELSIIYSVRFLVPLRPGDLMTLKARLRPVSEEKTFDVAAVVTRSDGTTVAQLKVGFCYGVGNGGSGI
jgi:3-hydroxyacyl-[acyl-carrier-protein] dehydratase